MKCIPKHESSVLADFSAHFFLVAGVLGQVWRLFLEMDGVL
jgi:hypothetical protein